MRSRQKSGDEGLNTSARRRSSAREIAAYVAQHFSALEVEALRRYLLEDCSFEALAAQLALPSPAEAQRLIRKLKERLRSHFRPDA